jgi:Domain of unknown function (DUF4281)
VKPTLESLFLLVNLLPLPFWFLMIALPHWRGTQRVMRGRVVLIPLLAAYSVLIASRLPELRALVANFELPTLRSLAGWLGRDEWALLAWIHFLAFDLFVGRWEYRDSRERRISAWLMAPVLTLTLLFGPLGLLVYLLVRALFRRAPAEPETS